MKIIVSQQDLPAGRHGKKLLISFISGKTVDKYKVDKADDFLAVLDRFFRKRRIKKIRRIGPVRLIGPMGMLTERIIRAIMLGLRFDFDNEQ